MSEIQDPPAGWTLSHFRAVCADVSSWTWGTVQGAFNEKASLTQIMVDAVIGMIPLVGDATAVRDLIAVIIGLSTQPEKRNSTWEWVLLVVLLFALIPVFGGVIKGVGRLVVKSAKDADHLIGAAREAHLRKTARDIIEFLNRIGSKDAEKWFASLRIMDYKNELLARFAHLISALIRFLKIGGQKVKGIPALTNRIKTLQEGLKVLLEKGNEMIPLAVKELDQQLREIQAFIRSGGEATSRVALHEIATGERVTTRAEERRLIESGVLPERSLRGGFRQNPAAINQPKKIARLYKHEPGYPDLLKSHDGETYEKLAAFSGKVVNRQLRDGEKIYRFFGPERVTHGTKVDESFASGAWWGLGATPQTAKEWREPTAVLDGFNGDGFCVTTTIVGDKGPKAVVGTVSEQTGSKIPGQHLPGGATQAFFFLEKGFGDLLRAAGQDFIKGTGPSKIIDPVTGMEFTFHKTDWKDANGIWGYFHTPGALAVRTERVQSRERATKENQQVTVQP